MRYIVIPCCGIHREEEGLADKRIQPITYCKEISIQYPFLDSSLKTSLVMSCTDGFATSLNDIKVLRIVMKILRVLVLSDGIDKPLAQS